MSRYLLLAEISAFPPHSAAVTADCAYSILDLTFCAQMAELSTVVEVKNMP